ncbi:unnamed protein product [Notodromas monacha]|uniref:Protein LLP homolog n=1 Tax=Notodromas monacha TaxID=399045 RepID=A0A7R9BF86_9CRUS|nr:unnamed protein product [Notodromas monacha]CAG0912730.1 unnamed protein product [Notodromas monacha]
MARSAHSKQFKRLQGIKRKRNAKKELQKLKALTAKASIEEKNGAVTIPNGLLVNHPRYYQRVAEELEEKNLKMDADQSKDSEQTMEIDTCKLKNKRVMKKNGAYPAWVSSERKKKFRKSRLAAKALKKKKMIKSK